MIQSSIIAIRLTQGWLFCGRLPKRKQRPDSGDQPVTARKRSRHLTSSRKQAESPAECYPAVQIEQIGPEEAEGNVSRPAAALHNEQPAVHVEVIGRNEPSCGPEAACPR